MSALVPIDWQRQLRSRIFAMFARTAWAPGIANAIGAESNIVDAAILAVAYMFSIDPITDDPASPAYGIGRGVQLDRIGRVVGQARGASNDDVYRLLLRARILANHSYGGPNQVIGVFIAAYNGVGTPLLIPGWIKAFTLRLVGVEVDPLAVAALTQLLGRCTEAGTYSVLEFSTVDSDHTFTWGGLGAHQTWGDITFGRDVGGMLGGARAPA